MVWPLATQASRTNENGSRTMKVAELSTSQSLVTCSKLVPLTIGTGIRGWTWAMRSSMRASLVS